jgi:hypothetical protein
MLQMILLSMKLEWPYLLTKPFTTSLANVERRQSQLGQSQVMYQACLDQ